MTAETQHTPGPFEVYHAPPYSNPRVRAQGTNRQIAMFEGDKSEANATLFAAAPQTRADLDALVVAAKAVYWSEGEELGQAWLSLREAIEQAERGTA